MKNEENCKKRNTEHYEYELSICQNWKNSLNNSSVMK